MPTSLESITGLYTHGRDLYSYCSESVANGASKVVNCLPEGWQVSALKTHKQLLKNGNLFFCGSQLYSIFNGGIYPYALGMICGFACKRIIPKSEQKKEEDNSAQTPPAKPSTPTSDVSKLDKIKMRLERYSNEKSKIEHSFIIFVTTYFTQIIGSFTAGFIAGHYLDELPEAVAEKAKTRFVKFSAVAMQLMPNQS